MVKQINGCVVRITQHQGLMTKGAGERRQPKNKGLYFLDAIAARTVTPYVGVIRRAKGGYCS